MAVAKKAPVKAVEDTSKLFRKLSAVFLINSSAFALLDAAKQTKTLAAADGVPIEFVASFSDLTNRITIREKLLAGKDISRELEFNGVELTEDERRVISLVTPILEKISNIGPKYPWLPFVDHSATISFTTDLISRNGYSGTKTAVKRIWEKASHHWSGGKKPSEWYQSEGLSQNKYVNITKTLITVGCQTFKRSEIEFIAQKCGWEPKVYEAKS